MRFILVRSTCCVVSGMSYESFEDGFWPNIPEVYEFSELLGFAYPVSVWLFYQRNGVFVLCGIELAVFVVEAQMLGGELHELVFGQGSTEEYICHMVI